jgi:hypothetical protein
MELEIRVPKERRKRSALFWVIARRRMVIFFTDLSGQHIAPIFNGQEAF